MKRILTTMCALTLLLAASVPALAAEPEQSASYYPTSVEEYIGIHHLPVHPIRPEIVLAVLGDKPPQPLSHIQHLELSE